MAAGDRTKTFSSDNIGNADAITVQSYCNYVRIQENAKANTTSYRIYEPFLTSGPITKAIGEPYEFQRPGHWSPGETIGYIETLDVAAATFSQEEKEL